MKKVDMEMEVGSVYEIDHSMLPPKVPIQLRNARVLMVSSRTEYKVSVTYPSNLSLQTFFNDEDGRYTRSSGLWQPGLDEKYVMGVNLAGEVLSHQIPFEEYAARRGTLSFWILPGTEPRKYNGWVNSEGCHDKAICLNGRNKKAVKCLKWVTRRKNRFICQNKEVGDDRVEEKRKVKSRKEMREAQLSKEGEPVVKKRRTCFRGAKKRGKKKLKLSQNVSSSTEYGEPVKRSRWSEQRYKSATNSILEVMKTKKAVYGNPILRPDLRTESRKVVGDTGLIDHILKHMAGEVAPDGKDRFRRRHNSEGHMEYWLESADLADIRREAGIIDPYWEPQPGWKPGDHLALTHHHGCADEINEVKEQMRDIKREIEAFGSRGQEHDQASVSLQPTDCFGNQEVNFSSMKTEYSKLLKRKADVDEQLLAIFSHMQELEVDAHRLLQAMDEKGKNNNATILTNEAHEESLTNKEERQGSQAAILATTTERAAKIQRLKSGFRLCKPEGTFLWPGMTSTTSTSSASLLGAHHPENQLLMSTTPSSVCSTTRCPSSSQADVHRLQLQKWREQLPVKPTAKKPPAAIVAPEAKDNDTPNPTGSSTFRILELDLNQVPKDVPITNVDMLSSPYNAGAYATTASVHSPSADIAGLTSIPTSTKGRNQLRSLLPDKGNDCHISVREPEKQIPTSNDLIMLRPQPPTPSIDDHNPLWLPPPTQFAMGTYVYTRRPIFEHKD